MRLPIAAEAFSAFQKQSATIRSEGERHMKNQTLRELFIKELQDLYDSENQIIKAMPKLIRAANSSSLSSSLEQHLEITKNQAIQLEDVFNKFGQQPVGKKCKGMEGLLKEAEEILKENMDSEVKDAAIISAVQKIEHYEIAGYGGVRTYAHLLGETQAANVLDRILSQEKDADVRLTALSEEINVDAIAGQSPAASSWKQSGASSRPSSNAGQTGHSLSANESGDPDSRSRRDV